MFPVTFPAQLSVAVTFATAGSGAVHCMVTFAGVLLNTGAVMSLTVIV